MLDIYATLEINKVLDNVAYFCKSDLNRKKLQQFKMYTNYDILNSELNLLKEAKHCILEHGPFPIHNVYEIDKMTDTASKGLILSINDLSHISNEIETLNKTILYFQKDKITKFSILKYLLSGLEDLSPLRRLIDHVVLPTLEINSRASEQLYSIRKNIQNIEQNIRLKIKLLISQYSDLMEENTYTLRNDRYVLPILSIHKGKVKGIIHDISDTGLTTFIEPSIIVELHNNLFSQKVAEKEEILKLLRELTKEVLLKKNELNTNNDILLKLDLLQAKVVYGENNNCQIASLSKDHIIKIDNARHPLIDCSVAIPNSFNLDGKQRIIIISGPNAGGKTVALKTLGLMIMMNQMALPIPVSSEAIISFFPKIYADIGDNQSLSDNLSTFSAHISNISRITKYVTNEDLVLLDELGTGTSPKEGEALAISIINFLSDVKCFSMISSHFDGVKEYCLNNQNVSNAMMMFDDVNLSPTYKLMIGIPGQSYGLIMAKRYKLNNKIINDASSYLVKNSSCIDESIEKLNKEILSTEKLKNELLKKENILKNRENILKQNEEKLSITKTKLIEDVEIEKDKILLDTMSKVDSILLNLKKENLKLHEVISARSAIKELQENDHDIEINNDNINDFIVGDYVKHKTIDFEGKITRINKNKIEIVSPDGFKLNTSFLNLYKVKPSSNKIVIKKFNDDLILSKNNIKMELNIIGKHVDEGLEIVSKYIDDSIMKNFTQVRIIHGKGSGALKQAVHDFLKQCPYVKSFELAGYHDGGSGATIVFLK